VVPGAAHTPDRTAGQIVVLHPGAMGAALAAQLAGAGASVGWVAEGRSAETRKRADAAGLRALGSIAEAAAWAESVLSVCPPHAAPAVARAVAATGFDGCFADLNAIAPQRMAEIVGGLDSAGATVVDGCLVGPPPSGDAGVRLYLAGEAGAVALLQALFEGTRVRTIDLDRRVGRASALKMAYALYSKGSLALAGLAAALAQELDVLDALDEEWRTLRSGSPTSEIRRSSTAAWRWSGEMGEIAAACVEAGLDPSLPEAAEALYRRWARHRGRGDTPRAQLLADLRR
jgi:3-hydroxyisobutyrate dehydrogenase-like beta-hydroxyacid dehydrogenase